MFGKANPKEQALVLMSGNGLVLAHVVTSLRASAIPNLELLNTLAVMGAAAVVGLGCGFVALGHAREPEGDKEYAAWLAGSSVGLGISLLTLLTWFVNISEIVERTATAAPAT